MKSHRRLPRVAVVERFRLVTQALELVLSPCCDPIAVPVQSLHSTDEVQLAVLRGRLDVVVLGDDLGAGVDAEQLVEELVARGIPVVALAGQPERRARLRRAGAVATPHPEEGIAGLRAAVLQAVGAVLPERVTPLETAPADPRRTALRRLGSLSRREVDVLALLMAGRCAGEIARVHVVSELTVRTQVRSILRKLGVDHQLAAVAVAGRAGWSPPLPEAA